MCKIANRDLFANFANFCCKTWIVHVHATKNVFENKEKFSLSHFLCFCFHLACLPFSFSSFLPAFFLNYLLNYLLSFFALFLICFLIIVFFLLYSSYFCYSFNVFAFRYLRIRISVFLISLISFSFILFPLSFTFSPFFPFSFPLWLRDHCFYLQPKAFKLDYADVSLAAIKLQRNETGYLAKYNITVLYTYGKGGK